jgi:hypothetical protein
LRTGWEAVGTAFDASGKRGTVWGAERGTQGLPDDPDSTHSPPHICARSREPTRPLSPGKSLDLSRTSRHSAGMTEVGARELTVRLVDDPREVECVAGAWLAEHAVVANVPATILAAELSGMHRHEDQSWALVSDADHRLVGMAMQTPHNAFVPPIGASAAVAVADAWRASGRALPGVIGDGLSGEAFVRRWTELAGVRARLEMREGVHLVGTFVPATVCPAPVTPLIRATWR